MFGTALRLALTEGSMVGSLIKQQHQSPNSAALYTLFIRYAVFYFYVFTVY